MLNLYDVGECAMGWSVPCSAEADRLAGAGLYVQYRGWILYPQGPQEYFILTDPRLIDTVPLGLQECVTLHNGKDLH